MALNNPDTARNAQRMQALNSGTSIRSLRAQLKRDLRARKADAGRELARLLLDPPAYLRSALIFDVLRWLPDVKGPRADVLLVAAGVTGPLLTVGELAPHQRQRLAEIVQLPVGSVRAKRPKAARKLTYAPILDDIAL